MRVRVRECVCTNSYDLLAGKRYKKRGEISNLELILKISYCYGERKRKK